VETPENLSWVVMVLAVAIVVGLFIAYQTSISAKELGEGIYVRILRSEYLPQSPFSLGGEFIYSSSHIPPHIPSISSSGGYSIDLRVGNLEDAALVELRFKTVGFGYGEVYLATGVDVTGGYSLENPLNPKESLEISLFIPSEYIPGEKILVVEGVLEDGRVASKSVEVP